MDWFRRPPVQPPGVQESKLPDMTVREKRDSFACLRWLVDFDWRIYALDFGRLVGWFVLSIDWLGWLVRFDWLI